MGGKNKHVIAVQACYRCGIRRQWMRRKAERIAKRESPEKLVSLNYPCHSATPPPIGVTTEGLMVVGVIMVGVTVVTPTELGLIVVELTVAGVTVVGATVF